MPSDVENTGHETWTVNFTTGASVTYQCDPHQSFMFGTFTVTGADSAASAASATSAAATAAASASAAASAATAASTSASATASAASATSATATSAASASAATATSATSATAAAAASTAAAAAATSSTSATKAPAMRRPAPDRAPARAARRRRSDAPTARSVACAASRSRLVGRVIGQSPQAGARKPRNFRVTLVVGRR